MGIPHRWQESSRALGRTLAVALCAGLLAFGITGRGMVLADTGAPEFAYSGDNGPGFWHETPGWEACAGTSRTQRQSPIDINDVAAIAQSANRGAQPIHTFVVGVFSDQDLGSDGVARLDTLARAGGSQKSVVINTASDVTGDLLKALNDIRDSSARCNFQLDETSLDLSKVNLEVIDGSGTATQLLNVSSAAACGADGQGWFYEAVSTGAGRQITVCPSTCRQFIAGSVRANLQIGCATRIR